VGRTSIDGILNQRLPPIAGLLQGIQIERDKIVEEEALDLTSKDVNLGPNDVQGVAVTTWRTRPCRSSSRPLFSSCQQLAATRTQTEAQRHTGIEQIKSIIQHVCFVCFCISSEDDKGVSNKQSGMTNSWTRALGSGRNGITAKVVGGGLDHPKIAFHSRAVDQTSHDVDGSILGGKRVGGSAVARKRMIRGDSEIKVSLRPGVWRGVLMRAHTRVLGRQVSGWLNGSGQDGMTAHLQVAVAALAQGLLLGTRSIRGLFRRPLRTVLQLLAQGIERIDTGSGCRRLLRLLPRAATRAVSRVSRSRRNI